MKNQNYFFVFMKNGRKKKKVKLAKLMGEFGALKKGRCFDWGFMPINCMSTMVKWNDYKEMFANWKCQAWGNLPSNTELSGESVIIGCGEFVLKDRLNVNPKFTFALYRLTCWETMGIMNLDCGILVLKNTQDSFRSGYFNGRASWLYNVVGQS